MFKILDGRNHFYQWDLERKLIVEDETIKEVHFCNRTNECSLVCEVYNIDGIYLVDVPNILLQDNWRVNVYAYDGSYTKHSAKFEVISRSKPADYVYTETEIKRWEDITERLEQLEDSVAFKPLPYYDVEKGLVNGGSMWRETYYINLRELESGVYYGFAPKEPVPPVGAPQNTYIFNMNIICDDETVKTITSLALEFPFVITKNNTSYMFTNRNIKYTITTTDLSTASAIKYTTTNNADYLGISNNSSYTPQNNYNPATKKYVDDSLKTAKVYADESHTIKPMPYYNVEENDIGGGAAWEAKYYIDLAELEKGVVYGLKADKTPPTTAQSITYRMAFSIICADGTTKNVTTATTNEANTFVINKSSNYNWNFIIGNTRYNINPNGLTTASNIDITQINNARYLSPNNNQEYTPTGNYNPATKKYVDDSLATAIADATAEPQYELIKKIEITEDGISNIQITDISLDKFILFCNVAQGTTTASVGFECYKGSTFVGYAWIASLINNASAKRSTCYGRNENGIAIIETTTPISVSPTIEATSPLARNVRYIEGNEPFTHLALYGSGGNSFPIGTVIELWGVRA